MHMLGKKYNILIRMVLFSALGFGVEVLGNGHTKSGCGQSGS